MRCVLAVSLTHFWPEHEPVYFLWLEDPLQPRSTNLGSIYRPALVTEYLWVSCGESGVCKHCATCVVMLTVIQLTCQTIESARRKGRVPAAFKQPYSDESDG